MFDVRTLADILLSFSSLLLLLLLLLHKLVRVRFQFIFESLKKSLL